MILFLILMITFNECLCLRTSDLCKQNSDSTINCYDSFENKCNQDYCTINKQACDDFLSLMIYVNLTESLKIKQTVSSMIQLIKPCRNKKPMMSINFCANSFACFKKDSRLSAKTSIGFNRSIFCPCVGEFRFKCNKYCTINSKACDSLKMLKRLPENVKKCGKYFYNSHFYFKLFIYFKIFFSQKILLKEAPCKRKQQI